MGRRGARPPLRSVPLPVAVGSGGPGRSSTRSSSSSSSSGAGRGLAVAGVSASWAPRSGRLLWAEVERAPRLEPRGTREAAEEDNAFIPLLPARGGSLTAGLPQPLPRRGCRPALPARLPLREGSRGGPGGERGLQPGAGLPPAGRRRRCAALRAEPPPRRRRRQRAGGCAALRGIRRPPGHPSAKQRRPQRDRPGLLGGAAPYLRGWAGCLRKSGFFFFFGLFLFVLLSFWW